MARPGQSAFVAAERITWTTLLTGAIATYKVAVAARPDTSDTLVLSCPEPFTDYPGMIWPNNLLFEQASIAFPYLMGYKGTAPEEEVAEAEGVAKTPKRRRSRDTAAAPRAPAPPTPPPPALAPTPCAAANRSATDPS
jgi:hypothetical protein